MTEKLEIYQCKICGNIVQVLLCGEGELVCCGQNMQKMTPNSTENVTTEYHIPIYKTDEDGNRFIQVGKEKHPMTEEHHIDFIERISNDKTCLSLKFLSKDEEPIMKLTNKDLKSEKALEYCNLHGLWEGCNNVE